MLNLRINFDKLPQFCIFFKICRDRVLEGPKTMSEDLHYDYFSAPRNPSKMKRLFGVRANIKV
jgi:hypothetical protein